MAVPRFVEVRKEGRAALINIEHIQSIEAEHLGATITTMDGRKWHLDIDMEAEVKYGGEIYAALHEIVEAWYCADKGDYEPLDSPYRDQVVATLIEGETIPVVVENPGEFRD